MEQLFGTLYLLKYAWECESLSEFKGNIAAQQFQAVV